MSEPSTFLESLRIIANYFHQRKVRYVIVGGVAVSVYGYPRSTQDIDLIVDHEELDIEDYCKYLCANHFQVTRDELLQRLRKNRLQLFSIKNFQLALMLRVSTLWRTKIHCKRHLSYRLTSSK